MFGLRGGKAAATVKRLNKGAIKVCVCVCVCLFCKRKKPESHTVEQQHAEGSGSQSWYRSMTQCVSQEGGWDALGARRSP